MRAQVFVYACFHNEMVDVSARLTQMRAIIHVLDVYELTTHGIEKQQYYFSKGLHNSDFYPFSAGFLQLLLAALH